MESVRHPHLPHELRLLEPSSPLGPVAFADAVIASVQGTPGCRHRPGVHSARRLRRGRKVRLSHRVDGSPPTHMWTYLAGPQWAKRMLLPRHDRWTPPSALASSAGLPMTISHGHARLREKIATCHRPARPNNRSATSHRSDGSAWCKSSLATERDGSPLADAQEFVRRQRPRIEGRPRRQNESSAISFQQLAHRRVEWIAAGSLRPKMSP